MSTFDKDPAVAVLAVQVQNLGEKFTEFRDEQRELMRQDRAENARQIAKLNEKVDAANRQIAETNQVLTKVQGGWIVVLGLGSLFMFLISFWKLIRDLF